MPTCQYVLHGTVAFRAEVCPVIMHVRKNGIAQGRDMCTICIALAHVNAYLHS